MALNFGRDLTPGEPAAIASYDYIDIAEGTGIVVFHGGATRSSSGGYMFRLGRNVFYSDIIASGGTNLGTDDLKLLDFDFDVQFKRPQIIEGNSLISIPIGVRGNVAASNYKGYAAVAVQKVSEGVETELFALTSGGLITSAQSWEHGYNTIEADIPKTHFKSDDTLRLQVQLYARGNAADTAVVMMGMDPNNRTQSGSLSGTELRWLEGSADLQFHVPFKLSI